MFLVELLVTFYHEALPHLQRLLACSLAYREGATQFIWTEPPKPDPGPRPMERMVKEEAHAIKGSAANLRLYRLAKVSGIGGTKAGLDCLGGRGRGWKFRWRPLPLSSPHPFAWTHGRLGLPPAPFFLCVVHSVHPCSAPPLPPPCPSLPRPPSAWSCPRRA